MKKMVSLLLVFLLMFAALPVGALAASERTVYISSTGKGTMNVRSGPGKTYSVKGYVHHGDTVEPLSASGEWSKVKVQDNGVTGWIKTKYIDGTTKTLGSGYKTVDVASGSNLNLRTGPGTGYAIKGKVADGSKVKVLNTEDDWVKVTVKDTGKTGWILVKYIGGASSESTPETPSWSFSQGVYHATASTLNVRKGPGSSYAKAGNLQSGEAFRVVGSSGNWFQIETFDGLEGWVSKNFSAAGAEATVTASSLNMRTGPGTGYGYIRSLGWGTEVTVNSVTGNWAYITVGGRTGYVSLNYLVF